MNKPISANGVVGCLLPIGNLWVFRVYDEGGDFTDYDIHHSDLKVTINDEDAYFYETPKGLILDHAPNTLGYGNDYLDL
ncbi:hypothetical protein EB001_03640 [bacterium]|jgi:hypothetical protein|nr:hypothetical protein [bacterium]